MIDVYYQFGPATDGTYRTLFHSALQEQSAGLGFALVATGSDSQEPCWVAFDNVRIVKN